MVDAPKLQHPEWVLFYRQGVAPERIADLNDVPVAKVRTYLRQVGRRHPQLLAGRLMLHDRPRRRPASMPDPDRRWKASLARLVAFMEEHGRRPYSTSYETTEGPLAQWLTTQRSKHRKGELAEHRARWLSRAVPGWEVDTRSLHYDAQWRVRLVDVLRFKGEHGRLPRREGQEEALATWLEDQRSKQGPGKLAAERRRALDRELPGWDKSRESVVVRDNL